MGSNRNLATRALETDMPVMVRMQKLLRGAKNCVSLAQGVVYWKPPEEALEKVQKLVFEPSISRYGGDDGLPELRAALIKKLRDENNLHKSSVMVTAGANQAFVNLVLTLCDAGDSVVMFAPYYFNSYMSFQMTGVTNILVGPGKPETLYPDADWLERILSETKPVPKLVTVVNPGNPSGTYIPESLLKVSLCLSIGFQISARLLALGLLLTTHMNPGTIGVEYRSSLWYFILFKIKYTCRYFMYDGLKHSCVEGNHIVNVFSFSKAYGMMGWRVGYIAYPSEVEGLADQLFKVQDNIPICASIISQHLALHSLEMGPEWVTERVKTLVKNREIVLEALSPLGEGSVKGGEGAIYLWAKLPEGHGYDDFEVVRWLANRHGVAVIPGSASGSPGNLRISFGGLIESECKEAAGRLKRGLEELVKHGLVKEQE
ncbi:hypothetical protein Ahy_B09g094760 isoform A [Arachis hypogaea]|uniref:Aminotransferase class I/classII large domain-containing protein n=2 Tax=Arachis hypogaea TaxID=3818 RepID=A0A444XCE4_ARAHY|nr:hypothetical protein Ahy_B09g094760 isoform A [Arachis hypogaea]